MEKKMSKQQAAKVCRSFLLIGSIIFTKHALEQMQKRGIETRDVFTVIKKGEIRIEPEIHPKTGRLTYNIEGETIDGRRLTVCTDIYATEKKAVIVTVF